MKLWHYCVLYFAVGILFGLTVSVVWEAAVHNRTTYSNTILADLVTGECRLVWIENKNMHWKKIPCPGGK